MRYDFAITRIRKRARLPHWEVRHGIYFVTFNLADAIPAVTRQRLLDEAEARYRVIAESRGAPTLAERNAIWNWLQDRLCESLDNGAGHCAMKDRTVAKIVADAIQFFDAKRYLLHAWCVMPNHVRVIFEIVGDRTLDSILHSWKSYTGNVANRQLGRCGEFWHEDYFDRTIRSPEELGEKIDYVANNPAKAELFEWPYVRMYPERIAAALP